MSIFFSAAERGFYDTMIHGARTVIIDDPDWVRPTIPVTLEPGEAVSVEGAPLVNETQAAITLEIPDEQAQPPRLEVPNPNCRLPPDAVEITDESRQALLAGVSQFRQIRGDENGYPVLVDLPGPSLAELLARLVSSIDQAADDARYAVAGDPLRAVEYDRARLEAEQYAAAGYQGAVPPMVAAWAINGRTAEEAADDILREAAHYAAALIALRQTRLAAKEQVRALIAAGQINQAQHHVLQTVAAIESAVSGVGNAQS